MNDFMLDLGNSSLLLNYGQAKHNRPPRISYTIAMLKENSGSLCRSFFFFFLHFNSCARECESEKSDHAWGEGAIDKQGCAQLLFTQTVPP